LAASAATTPGKKIRGRKRHILVDTLGNLLKVVVHPADFQDAEGAELVLLGLRASFRRLALLWADRAYEAARDWIEGELGLALEIVARAAGQQGFVALPKRWIVERTLAWLSRNRRLSKDYEHFEVYSESMVYIASIHLLLRKLAV
jgi:putative transposase